MSTGPSSPVTLSSHLTSLFPQQQQQDATAAQSRTHLTTTVLPSLLSALSQIAHALARAHTVSLAGTANTFGDDQLNVDVLAEKILRDTLAANCAASVVTASSEEDPVERAVVVVVAEDETDKEGLLTGQEQGQAEETYTVAFDPLDGSSIIAPNWTVGTILGIWDGRTAIGHAAPATQIAAVLGIYGPRTTAIIALRIPNTSISTCFEVALSPSSSSSSFSPADTYEVLRPEITLAPPPFKTRYFAPANLRAAGQDPKYLALVNRYIAEGYTLRYSGGLVPDVVHALVKGHGIYVSPVTAQSKAKLRRLYELFPLALIVECAGGMAVDPVDGTRILDAVLESTDERAGLVCGTKEEVELVVKALVG